MGRYDGRYGAGRYGLSRYDSRYGHGARAGGSGRLGEASLASTLLGAETNGFVFLPQWDQVLVRDAATPANNFYGTVQGAIDASVISFTRATNASRVNASGLIETVSSGIWRREYSPTTLQPLGYLPEPSRINIATYSEDYRTTAEAGGTRPWTASGSTVATANATGPDGLTSATTLTESASGSVQVQRANGITFANATAYTFSVFVKKGGRQWVQLFFGSAAFGVTQYANFDLDNLTVGTVGAGVTSYSIKDVGNSWRRLSITATSTAGAASVAAVQIADSGTMARAANITAAGLTTLLYGAQVEAGAYATSYIPTTSATVTRNADVMTVALSKLPYSATASTLIAIAQPGADDLTNTYMLAQLELDTNNRIGITNGTAASKQARGLVVSGGSALHAPASSANAAAARFKAAISAAANDFQTVVNGVSIGTTTSGAMPTAADTLRVGQNLASTNRWNAPIESLVYIPRRLSQAEMIARTA